MRPCQSLFALTLVLGPSGAGCVGPSAPAGDGVTPPGGVVDRSTTDGGWVDDDGSIEEALPCIPTVSPAAETDACGFLGGAPLDSVPESSPLPQVGWCRTDWTWEELCLPEQVGWPGYPDDPCPEFWQGIARDDDCGWQRPRLSDEGALATLLPASRPSWIELRDLGGDPRGASPDSSCGTPCLGATDVPTCLGALASQDEPSFPRVRGCEECRRWSLIVNANDDVWVLDAASLPMFVGRVDTALEASILVGVMGFMPIASPESGQGSVVRVGSGWLVVAVEQVPGYYVRDDRVLLHVSSDGVVTELRRNILYMECEGS